MLPKKLCEFLSSGSSGNPVLALSVGLFIIVIVIIVIINIVNVA